MPVITDLQTAIFLHFNAVKELVRVLMSRLFHLDLGVAVLSVGVGLDVATMGPSDLLKTVTDTHDRYARLENSGIDMRRIGRVDRVW